MGGKRFRHNFAGPHVIEEPKGSSRINGQRCAGLMESVVAALLSKEQGFIRSCPRLDLGPNDIEAAGIRSGVAVHTGANASGVIR
jgi:hypothetical protein